MNAELLPVYLSGVAKISGKRTGDDMVGHVVKVDLNYNLISVKWDHWAMAQQGPMKYATEDFRNTRDRDGREWLVLHI